MRTTSLVLLCAACSAEVAGPISPASVHDRLELTDTRLVISSPASAGSITAQRRTADGWSAAFVALHIASGELVASADDAGGVTLERLAIGLGPIPIPSTALGYEAQLTNVQLELAAATRVEASWTGEDESHGMLELPLTLSWSLSHHGQTSPLGAPELPAVPVELLLYGDGSVVHAELRAHAPGELWSWANLLKLEELTLILSAQTPVP